MYHDGSDVPRQGWTGMNWSSGGGLGSTAYLERQFGNLWIDSKSRKAIPIDGLYANILELKENSVSLTVQSALVNLKAPYDKPRSILIKFSSMPKGLYSLKVNGRTFKEKFSSDQLESGVFFDLL